MNSYYDEKNAIIVSGHQDIRIGLVVASLFGPVAYIAADQAYKTAPPATPPSTLPPSLSNITHDVLTELINKDRCPEWNMANATNPLQLQLSPYAEFNILKSGKVRLYAILRAELFGHDGEALWSVRYFVTAPGEFPLDGEQGWANNNRFHDAIAVALRIAVQTCMDDTQGHFTDSRKVMAAGVFPFFNYSESLEQPFIVVQDNGDSVVARLALGNMSVLSGTHVLNKTQYTFTDSNFSDPRQP